MFTEFFHQFICIQNIPKVKNQVIFKDKAIQFKQTQRTQPALKLIANIIYSKKRTELFRELDKKYINALTNHM